MFAELIPELQSPVGPSVDPHHIPFPQVGYYSAIRMRGNVTNSGFRPRRSHNHDIQGRVGTFRLHMIPTKHFSLNKGERATPAQSRLTDINDTRSQKISIQPFQRDIRRLRVWSLSRGWFWQLVTFRPHFQDPAAYLGGHSARNIIGHTGSVSTTATQCARGGGEWCRDIRCIWIRRWRAR